MTGRISKSVSGLIGLGQEAIQHHKDKKAATAAQDAAERDPAATSEDEYDEDEDDWIADDTQDQLHEGQDIKQDESPEGPADWFKKRHPAPDQAITPKGRLPAPVIVPQKRPDMRSRGFVRAYAPALAECNVDQAAFLDFLEGFHKEINKHGYFNATNLAVALSVMSYTLSVAPSAIVHFTALAVHTSIEAGRRLYISKKTNSYIDEINAYYFQPRGLYAMIMTYKPDSKDSSSTLDFDTATATAVDTRHNTDSKPSTQDYKSSSGKMLNQQIPECCPLIFPELERASGEQKQNAFKRSLAFTRDYYDRRGQAEFAAKNPDSALNVQPEPQFAGSHGDPTSFSNSGLLGVATGGRIDPRQRRWERRNMLRERLGKEGTPAGSSGRRGGLLGKDGLVRRQLGENVLYLMVVNMPSEEELQAAKEAEERMKAEEPGWFEKFVGGR